MYSLHRLPRYHRMILIILVLWIFYFFSDHLPGVKLALDYSRRWHSLQILNTTRWDDFRPTSPADPTMTQWLDLAGFREEDGFAWKRLQAWKWKCLEFGECPRSELRQGKDLKWKKGFEEEDWGNVTGVWSGEWVRYTRDLDEKEKFWSIKSRTMDVMRDEGRATLRVEEEESLEMVVRDTRGWEYDLGYVAEESVSREPALVREVAATLTIQDESASDNGHEVRVYGVHWPRIGVLLMTTTSEKFAGIFGLPHLSLSWEYFTTSQRLLSATVGKTPEGIKAISYNANNRWTARPGAKADATRLGLHCQYVVYMQMELLESGVVVRQPDDASILGTQELQMATAIFSPDCGFILESKQPPKFSPIDKTSLQHVCKTS